MLCFMVYSGSLVLKTRQYQHVVNCTHKFYSLVIESNGTVGTTTVQTFYVLITLTGDKTGNKIRTLFRVISYTIAKRPGRALAQCTYSATTMSRGAGLAPLPNNNQGQPRADKNALAAT